MPVPNRPRPSPPARPRAAPLLAALLLGGAGALTGAAAFGQTPGAPGVTQPAVTQPTQTAPAPEPGAPLVPQVAAPEPPQAAPPAAEVAPVLPGVDAGRAADPSGPPATGAGTAAPAAGGPETAAPEPAAQGTAPPEPTAQGASTPALTGLDPAAPGPVGPGPVGPGPVGPGAEAVAVEPAGVDRATLPHDLSPIGMFRAADWVVKGVMIGLAFASLVTWTIFLAKLLEFAAASRALRRGLRVVTRAETLLEAAEALEGWRDPVALMAQGALQEAQRSEPTLDHGGAPGLKERVASYLGRTEAAGVRRLNRGTGLLATIGSTAPFVGLFGTVWGIMNSFIGISEAQTTNLAVVAPGIAEALLATAIGLVAAIPAVVIYNLFARMLGLYRAGLGDAAAAVERLVSRDLDFRDLPPAEPRRRA